MRALDLAELKAAAEGLERMIAAKKREMRDNDRNSLGEPLDLVDKYMMQYPTGAQVLAPMLAAQITIVNQIAEIERIVPRPTPHIQQCLHWMVTQPCGLAPDDDIHHDRSNPDYHAFVSGLDGAGT